MKKRLLESFGSLEGIRRADTGQLRKVAGVGQALAERIKQRLKPDA
jgi:excinuclease UvrABC nuclease subunit